MNVMGSKQIQTVYVEKNPDKDAGTFHIDQAGNEKYLSKQSGYFFTPEELNKLKREVAEKAIWWMEEYSRNPNATVDGIANYINVNYPIPNPL